jgi:hypothetical protein
MVRRAAQREQRASAYRRDHFAQENVDVILATEYGPERTRNFVCRK